MTTRKYWLAALAGAVLLHSTAVLAHDDDDDDDDHHGAGHHRRYERRIEQHYAYRPGVVFVQPGEVEVMPPPVGYAPAAPAVVYEPRVDAASALAPVIFGAALGAYLGHLAGSR